MKTMKLVFLYGFTGLIALLTLLMLRVEAQEKDTESNQKSRPKWEYKTLECYDQRELAKMGDEGWEMVAVAETINKWKFGFSTPVSRYEGEGRIKLSESTGANGEMNGHRSCSMFFKRQK